MNTIARPTLNTKSIAHIGGKAHHLHRLQEMDFPVPRWMVIPNTVLLDLLPEALQTSENLDEIHAFIEQLSVPRDIMEEIEAFFQLSQNPSLRLAVRSSAIDEDGSSFSFAGQFDSFLSVKPEQIDTHIRKVWQSAFSERVAAYRQAHQLAHQAGIAVIIQEMVEADVAGVAFGMDPRTGDRSAKVMSAVYGLGEGLVSGALDADTFVMTEVGIEERIVKKEQAYVADRLTGGVKVIEIEADQQMQASLKPAQIQVIADILDQLKQNLGKAQDIEFAFAENQLYLLQTRPITQVGKLADQTGKRIVWDNSNIIESYPGVTTPLTFSFIIKMYEAVYTQFGLLLGIHPSEVEAHQHTFANMLGILNGRVYYNLLSWYKLLSLLPGYALNARYMEKMMGVKERFDLEANGPKLSKTKAWIRIASTAFKMIRSLVRLPKERKRFQAFLDEVIAEYQAIDFDQRRPEELMQLYRRFERILVKEWKAPLINDFFAMIYFGTLEKLIQKWQVGTNPNLHNDLHCGSQDIISTEPITRLLDLTKLISSNPEARSFFIHGSPKDILSGLEKGLFPAINEQIASYIERFGERCVGELKLETISYKQDPTVLISIIQSYVKQGVSAKRSETNIEEELRIAAEKEVQQSLKGKWLKGMLFRYVLRMSRALVSSRENLRYERTRGFGMVRSMFTAIGKQFYAEGIIEEARDIFYLSKEEIFAYINGTAISTRLTETIASRKEEYASYREMDQPSERIPTYGVVYHGNDFYPSGESKAIEGDLKGIGCCPGSVRGKVRVIRDPREVNGLDGDILVTSSTDPGWVTLFPTSAAIIVERGSLLSHSAIVSREMGIPCIVGVTGLLATLKTGDEIDMDGSTGNIQRISSHA